MRAVFIDLGGSPLSKGLQADVSSRALPGGNSAYRVRSGCSLRAGLWVVPDEAMQWQRRVPRRREARVQAHLPVCDVAVERGDRGLGEGVHDALTDHQTCDTHLASETMCAPLLTDCQLPQPTPAWPN